MHIFLPLLVSLSLSFIACAWFARQRLPGWLDQPGERSLHATPVPRLGGVGIWAGVVAGGAMGMGYWSHLFDACLLAAATLLAVAALLDDARSLPASVRLLCQCGAAALAVFGAGLFVALGPLDWYWYPLGILMYLWGINLYNFMDGMDGFAGGMAVFGFGGLAVCGLSAGDAGFAFVNGLLVCASLGFLLLNFPPARLFMGDLGSTLMGFAMVSLGILGWQRDLYPVWVPLVLFSPFWVDATVTLACRSWKRERIWEAHRQHYYQRWVLAGLGHRKVVLVEYALMALCLMMVMAWQLGIYRYNEIGLLLSWAMGGVAVLVCSEYWLRQSGFSEKAKKD